MSKMLKARLVLKITQAESAGMSRTELMQSLRCTRDELDTVLQPLLAVNELREWTDLKSLGRPATRYYAKGFALELAAEKNEALPITEFATRLKRTTICKICGVAIPVPDLGHPYSYCSERCKRVSREGGTTLREFLFRAGEPRTFAEAAILLVMADLVIRGFRVGRDLFQGGSRILVMDHEGSCYLDVVPISSEGSFPNPEEFVAMAAVYRDGRIVYGGRNPIVVTENENVPESENV